MTALGDLRTLIALALDEIPAVAAGDWMVLDSPVDAVEPPALLIIAGPGGGTRSTFCAYDVQMEIICISGRLEPEANAPVLEEMIEATVAALEAAGLGPDQWLAPGPEEIAQITYLAARVQLSQRLTVTMPAPPLPPPPPGEAGWAWSDRTPQQVGGTTYQTVPGDPQFLPGAAATGMEYVAQNEGTIEAVRFWRHGGDPTPSRRLGVWWWQPGVQELGHVTVTTDGETGRTEGWVTVDLPAPVEISTADELHARFIVLAEVPLGSGFYRSPWTDSTWPPLKHQRARGRPLGVWPPPTGTWPDWPPPDVYPSGAAPGVTVGDTIWADTYFRPSTT